MEPESRALSAEPSLRSLRFLLREVIVRAASANNQNWKYTKLSDVRPNMHISITKGIDANTLAVRQWL